MPVREDKDLEVWLRNMSSAELDEYKNRLRGDLETLGPSDRFQVIRRLEGVPELSDVTSPEAIEYGAQEYERWTGKPISPQEYGGAIQLAGQLGKAKERPWTEQAVGWLEAVAKQTPFHPQYWQDPQERARLNTIQYYEDYARALGMPNPREWAEGLVEYEPEEGEMTVWGPSTPEEETLRLPTVPHGGVGELHTPGERAVGEWGMPMAVLGMSGIPPAIAGWRAAGQLPKPAMVAARTALAPVVAAEQTLKYGVTLPVKGISAGARKAFELALDTGLDRWLIRQGIRGDQANKVVRFFLEKNNRWLYQKAEANWLRRVAQKKGVAQTAEAAASDTIKQAEPLLLRASEEVAAKPKPPKVAELPVGVTERPTVPIEMPTPSGVTFAEMTAPISSAQVTGITEIATAKLLISAAGKVTPQLRRLMRTFTGKTRIQDLAQDEANVIIEALERLPEAGYRGGRRVPPSIPTSARVTTENFFNIEFRKPTPIKYFTSQNYYAEILGVKPLVEPLELAKQRLDLEYTALQNSIKGKVQEIDKVAGTSLVERATAKTKNVPTKAIARMRDLLDKHEVAPAFLTPEEAKLFNWFRNLNRSMLRGENEVRRILGMPEIPYRRAYVRHVADGLAYEILAGKYPLPEGLKYWASRIVGKKIHNPMEMARSLSGDLEQYFTRDLAYATNSMVYTALREIHLSQPLHAFTQQLSALSKDLPVYKSLTAREMEALRKIDVMPAATKRWVVDYVNQVIKGQPTGLDEAVNRMLVNRGLAAVINKFLRPFGRSLGRMPITKLATTQGRLVISGAMGSPIGGRPRQIIRNKFQGTQNLALYTIRANIKGNLPIGHSPEELSLKELLDESLFLKGYTGLEELPIGVMAKLERWGVAGYQWSAISNARSALKVAFWDTLELITKPKYAKYGLADPQRTYTEARGFLYPSERAALLKEMEFGAGATQYQYIGMGMPEVFRNKTLVPLTRLQSWWMNYFFKFHREAITRAFTGKTSYGARLPWSRRLGWFKYLLLGGAVLLPMGYTASYLAGVLPSNLAPVGQFAMAFYNYTTASSEYERTKALNQMYSSWQVMIPSGLAFKEFAGVFGGTRPIETLFFYATDQSVIYSPEEAFITPEEKIENDIWDRYPAEYRKIAERIQALEETDPTAARRLQMQHPEILAIRRQIALAKTRGAAGTREEERSEWLKQREEALEALRER